MDNYDTIDTLYRGLQDAYRRTQIRKNDNVTCYQDVTVEPVGLKIVFEVKARNPEEALGKILLAARTHPTIRIRA